MQSVPVPAAKGSALHAAAGLNNVRVSASALSRTAQTPPLVQARLENRHIPVQDPRESRVLRAAVLLKDIEQSGPQESADLRARFGDRLLKAATDDVVAFEQLYKALSEALAARKASMTLDPCIVSALLKLPEQSLRDGAMHAAGQALGVPFQWATLVSGIHQAAQSGRWPDVLQAIALTGAAWLPSLRNNQTLDALVLSLPEQVRNGLYTLHEQIDQHGVPRFPLPVQQLVPALAVAVVLWKVSQVLPKLGPDTNQLTHPVSRLVAKLPDYWQQLTVVNRLGGALLAAPSPPAPNAELVKVLSESQQQNHTLQEALDALPETLRKKFADADASARYSAMQQVMHGDKSEHTSELLAKAIGESNTASLRDLIEDLQGARVDHHAFDNWGATVSQWLHGTLHGSKAGEQLVSVNNSTGADGTDQPSDLHHPAIGSPASRNAAQTPLLPVTATAAVAATTLGYAPALVPAVIQGGIVAGCIYALKKIYDRMAATDDAGPPAQRPASSTEPPVQPLLRIHDLAELEALESTLVLDPTTGEVLSAERVLPWVQEGPIKRRKREAGRIAADAPVPGASEREAQRNIQQALADHLATLDNTRWLSHLTAGERQLWVALGGQIEENHGHWKAITRSAQTTLGEVLEAHGWQEDDAEQILVRLPNGYVDGHPLPDELPLLEYCLYRKNGNAPVQLTYQGKAVSDSQATRLNAVLNDPRCTGLTQGLQQEDHTGVLARTTNLKFKMALLEAKARGNLQAGPNSVLRGLEIATAFSNGDPHVEYAYLDYTGLADAGKGETFSVPGYLVLRSTLNDPDHNRRGQVVIYNFDEHSLHSFKSESSFRQYLDERRAASGTAITEDFTSRIVKAAPANKRDVLKSLLRDTSYLGRPEGWSRESHIALDVRTVGGDESSFVQWGKEAASGLLADVHASESTLSQQQRWLWSPLGRKVHQAIATYDRLQKQVPRWPEHARLRINEMINTELNKGRHGGSASGAELKENHQVLLTHRIDGSAAGTGQRAARNITLAAENLATSDWEKLKLTDTGTDRIPYLAQRGQLQVEVVTIDKDGQTRTDDTLTARLNKGIFPARLAAMLELAHGRDELRQSYQDYLANLPRTDEGQELAKGLADSLKWRMRGLLSEDNPGSAGLNSADRKQLQDELARVGGTGSPLREVTLGEDAFAIPGLLSLHANGKSYVFMLGEQGDRLLNEQEFEDFLADNRARAEAFVSARAPHSVHSELAELFGRTRSSGGLTVGYLPVPGGFDKVVQQWFTVLGDNARYLKGAPRSVLDWLESAAEIGLLISCLASSTGVGAAICAAGSAAFAMKALNESVDELGQGNLGQALGKMAEGTGTVLGAATISKVSRVLFQTARKQIATVAEAGEAIIEFAGQLATFDKTGLLLAGAGLVPGVGPLIKRTGRRGADEFIRGGRTWIRAADGQLTESARDVWGVPRAMVEGSDGRRVLGPPIEFKGGKWRQMDQQTLDSTVFEKVRSDIDEARWLSNREIKALLQSDGAGGFSQLSGDVSQALRRAGLKTQIQVTLPESKLLGERGLDRLLAEEGISRFDQLSHVARGRILREVSLKRIKKAQDSFESVDELAGSSTLAKAWADTPALSNGRGFLVQGDFEKGRDRLRLGAGHGLVTSISPDELSALDVDALIRMQAPNLLRQRLGLALSASDAELRQEVLKRLSAALRGSTPEHLYAEQLSDRFLLSGPESNGRLVRQRYPWMTRDEAQDLVEQGGSLPAPLSGGTNGDAAASAVMSARHRRQARSELIDGRLSTLSEGIEVATALQDVIRGMRVTLKSDGVKDSLILKLSSDQPGQRVRKVRCRGAVCEVRTGGQWTPAGSWDEAIHSQLDPGELAALGELTLKKRVEYAFMESNPTACGSGGRRTKRGIDDACPLAAKAQELSLDEVRQQQLAAAVVPGRREIDAAREQVERQLVPAAMSARTDAMKYLGKTHGSAYAEARALLEEHYGKSSGGKKIEYSDEKAVLSAVKSKEKAYQNDVTKSGKSGAPLSAASKKWETHRGSVQDLLWVDGAKQKIDGGNIYIEDVNVQTPDGTLSYRKTFVSNKQLQRAVPGADPALHPENVIVKAHPDEVGKYGYIESEVIAQNKDEYLMGMNYAPKDPTKLKPIEMTEEQRKLLQQEVAAGRLKPDNIEIIKNGEYYFTFGIRPCAEAAADAYFLSELRKLNPEKYAGENYIHHLGSFTGHKNGYSETDACPESCMRRQIDFKAAASQVVMEVGSSYTSTSAARSARSGAGNSPTGLRWLGAPLAQDANGL